MANDYFSFTLPTVPHTQARADLVNTLFRSVETAFDQLPAVPDMLYATAAYAGLSTGAAGQTTIYALTPARPIAGYHDGMAMAFRAHASNSGPATVDISGQGPKPVLRPDGTSLAVGDISAGAMVSLRYDGVSFRMTSVPEGAVVAAAAQATAAQASASSAAAYASNANSDASAAAGHASTALLRRDEAASAATAAANSATAAAASASTAASAITGRVAKAGDTMTGKLTVALSAANGGAAHFGSTVANGITVWQDGSMSDGPSIICGSARPLRFGTQTGHGAIGYIERARFSNVGDFLLGSPTQLLDARLEISSDGRTGIGVNMPATPSTVMAFTSGGQLVGSIFADGGTSYFVSNSDFNLKTNWAPPPDSGPIFDAIDVWSFDWRSNGRHVPHGIIAQHLAEVYPDAAMLVGTQWMISPTALIPLMVAELKSLRSRVAVLEGGTPPPPPAFPPTLNPPAPPPVQ